MNLKTKVVLYIVAFVIVLAVFVLLAQDEGYQAMMADVSEKQTPERERLFDLFDRAALFLFGGLAAAMVWQIRRVGYSWRYCLNPLNFSTRYFDTTGWVVFAIVVAIAFGMVMEAFPLSPIQ